VPHFDNADPLLARILGRTRSLFADDVERHRPWLAQAIAGRSVLVVGAAGSIGGAFVRQLAAFAPRRLHLVDVNENTLVEVVRELRSSSLALPEAFRSVSVALGSAEFDRFTAAHGPYDVFINFSALKHVRSERDVYSLMRMVDTNVRALHDWLAGPSGQGLERAFSVSTDKSVRPVNLMGATKNLMEQVLFAHGDRAACTSARFANVAFSAGSLLEGFEQRLAKGQAIAAPRDVKRYFISHEEAGQLCLLACFLGESREVFFPKMTPEDDLMSLSDIADSFLRHHGLEPVLCESEEEARRAPAGNGRWPCWFSTSDTTGEKAFEEFHRPGDPLDTARFAQVAVSREAAPDPRVIETFLAEIARLRAAPDWAKADVVRAIRAAVPELDHVELDRSLDQKM
jgi:FlaA1/EpsC-like NDP-sugar epimerase